MQSNYWFGQYGSRSSDFIAGMIAATKEWAVWKDGTQVIGTRERPLTEVIEEIKEGLQ